MRLYYLILVVLFNLSNSKIVAQDSLSAKKIKILPVPSIGYSPETRTYIGAVALFTFKPTNTKLTRTSNAKLEVNYTWNKQIIVECGWNYFFNKEAWFTRGLISYSHYPDLYFGIGSNTPDSNKLSFNSNRFNLEVFALKKIGKQLFSGLSFKYLDYSKITYKREIRNYPELVASSVTGIGVAVLKDSRNSILTATSGAYVFFNTGFNYSKTNYVETTLDLRYYKTWKNKFTWANRFINYINTGEPPFYALPFLGGDKNVRGYYYGRYRDNNLSSIQSEFRVPVYWRIGLAAFGGLSLNYASFQKLSINQNKYNVGLGLRFLVDKQDKTNLRLDYAIGENGNSGFYISFGESF